MNTYYRLIVSNGTTSKFRLNPHMKNLEVPYYLWEGIKYRKTLQKRHYHKYYWFTKEWFDSYISKHLNKDQYIAILKTNTNPFFLDGQQATFKYRGSEKVKHIKIIKAYELAYYQ